MTPLVTACSREVPHRSCTASCCPRAPSWHERPAKPRENIIGFFSAWSELQRPDERKAELEHPSTAPNSSVRDGSILQSSRHVGPPVRGYQATCKIERHHAASTTASPVLHFVIDCTHPFRPRTMFCGRAQSRGERPPSEMRDPKCSRPRA